MIPLGSSDRNQWRVSAAVADLARPVRAPVPVAIAAEPQALTFDLARSALLVIDMQNDFCHPDGWLASIGVDVAPARAPIEPLGRLTAALRARGAPIIWLNWGIRPDRLNLSPSLLHVYKPTGEGVGMGDPLASNGAPVLTIQVSKHRMSGFWDTPLDSILRNLGLTTLLFAGVNVDQCVLCTLQDANFLGYDCLLVADCSATTSPDYCTAATLYNVKQCFGFVTQSGDVLAGLETLGA